MRILHAADHKSMPWKNGGGVTTEIAVSPEGAGLNDFDWRISMARVESDGPFSAFPGIDRTLAVLEGDGIRLAIGDRPPLLLTSASEPLAFAADEPTHGTLLGGPILDLNVMARRVRFRATVRRIDVNGASDFTPGAEFTLIFANRGRVLVDRHGTSVDLADKDCVLVDGDVTPLTLNASEDAELFLIELSRTG